MLSQSIHRCSYMSASKDECNHVFYALQPAHSYTEHTETTKWHRTSDMPSEHWLHLYIVDIEIRYIHLHELHW